MLRKIVLLGMLMILGCSSVRQNCSYIGQADEMKFTPVSWYGSAHTYVSTDFGFVVIQGIHEIHIGDSLFICYDKTWEERIRIKDQFYVIIERYIR